MENAHFALLTSRAPPEARFQLGSSTKDSGAQATNRRTYESVALAKFHALVVQAATIQTRAPIPNGATVPVATLAQPVRFVTQTTQTLASTWRGRQENVNLAKTARALHQLSGS